MIMTRETTEGRKMKGWEGKWQGGAPFNDGLKLQ